MKIARSFVMLLGFALVLPLAMAQAGLGVSPQRPAVINGFSPYILGTEIRTVFRADPELTRGNYPLWAHELFTYQYGRSLVAPIGGVNYIALLGLQFWQGRLAAVILQWPASSFDSEYEWHKAAASFRNRIAVAYAGAAHKRFALTSESVWSIDLADAEGNALVAWSIDRPYVISVAYLWAPYVRGLESLPGSGSGY
jgi:hypothetical protein